MSHAKELSRRDFLKGSAAGFAGLAAMGAGIGFWARTTSNPALADEAFQGSWIRRSGEDASVYELTYARAEMEARGQIVRAIAIASATYQYELWINGNRADFGQSFNHADRQYYQTTDVTKYLRSGESNAVGMRYHWYWGGQGRPVEEPGMFLELHVEYADGSEDVVVSDRTWRVRNAEWQASSLRVGGTRDIVERIDAREHPDGWSEPGFDESDWEEPELVGRHPTEPWASLTEAEARITEVWAAPVSVTRLDSGAYVVDYGKVMAAHPVVRFHQGQAGRAVSMRAGYLLRGDGEVEDDPARTQRADMSYYLIQRDGEWEFLPFHYLGFRYFQVDDPGEELTADDFAVVPRYNKVPDEHAATFESSDDVLDAVFELCRHSALHGSQEQFIDTPTREKGPFLGDAVMISQSAMRAFGERALTRQGLREFKQSQERYYLDDPSRENYGAVNAVYPTRDGRRDIPDYTQKYVHWVWWYYFETGDVDMLAELYTTVRNITEWMTRSVDGQTGLIHNLAGGDRAAYRFGIVDWPPDGRFGYPFPDNPDMFDDARTTVNVFGVMVYRLMAQISEVLGRSQSEIDLDRQREAALIEAINSHLIGPDGYYVSVLRRTAGLLLEQLEHAGQHANSYPLAWDIVPEENRQAVVDRVVELRIAQGPMTCHWLLTAIENAGLTEHLVDILTDETIPGWANILSRGATFTWDSWNARDLPGPPVPGGSESHAWGATALIALQRQLLGVRLTQAGAAAVDIRPDLGGLDFVKGTVPTERGSITVDVTQDPRYDLRVDVPENISARLLIPLNGDDPDTFRITGPSRERRVEEDTLILDRLRAGRTRVFQQKHA